MPRAATRVLVGLLWLVVAVRPAAASAPRDLGHAFEAYRKGDLGEAQRTLAKIPDAKIVNRDYLWWLRGMVALRTNDLPTAQRAFTELGKLKGSRFVREAPWRLADIAWERGERAAAAKAYGKLVAAPDAGTVGDVGTALYRIAESKTGPAALAAYRALVLANPGHPLAKRAERILVERGAPPLTNDERIERAKRLTEVHLWDEAVAELQLLDDQLPDELDRLRDYWLGITLFKMRRRYGDAGVLLLGVYPKMGDAAAEAMFHGARALSRADRDDDAIGWYKKVVAAYPNTPWAQEAQYLSGWLEFNRGRYKQAIAPLEESLRLYPRSKWVDDALWFLGMSHYFLGDWPAARARLDALAKRGGSLEGGKGMYWLARIDEKLGNKPDAIAGYTKTLQRYPFSWYALLSRSRLAALGVKLGPFGVEAPSPKGPKLAATIDPALATDDLIRRVDELIAAGLSTDAGEELARNEKPFLKRHDHAAAFAMLLDRYKKANNFNRPWMLAISYSGDALDGPAIDDARRWWENAYPRAYRDLVEKYQKLGDNPEGYLYSIMRKESGFNPHDLSYADAQGLLQMIPATTKRVAKELKIPYDPGRLYEPAFNIQTGSWYIGRLLQKFKSQVPIGAGSFNSGPRPVMKWLDQNGDREIDEFVELVPYTQTREYMKKVTENYARYRYLYQNEVYEQPLTVDKHYVQDQLTY
ncbi:MAG TPA: transglycosylase SLT domain-containing protein [Kofleriaceae bacterium]|nr:transglycosylase SLT domain-containing protein [Kofleriaceae bacterium]